MTIDTIFSHYAVPETVQQEALRKAAFAMQLAEAWVGPDVTWSIVTKGLIFASLGEQSGHIRKKVGLDKYIVTLIARGQPQFAETIAASHDIHQLLYAYGSWYEAGDVQRAHGHAWNAIRNTIVHNLLHDVGMPTTLDPKIEQALRAINILHYKNPSV